MQKLSARQIALSTFIALSAKRIAGEYGNTETTVSPGNVAFRRAVCDTVVAEAATSLESAGSAYNYAFQKCKIEHPELCAQLGRAEDKIGGRKRKSADPVEANAGNLTPVNEKLVSVVKVKDGSVFAENLTVEQADALIAEHAKMRNKPNLKLQEAEVEATA